MIGLLCAQYQQALAGKSLAYEYWLQTTIIGIWHCLKVCLRLLVYLTITLQPYIHVSVQCSRYRSCVIWWYPFYITGSDHLIFLQVTWCCVSIVCGSFYPVLWTFLIPLIASLLHLPLGEWVQGLWILCFSHWPLEMLVMPMQMSLFDVSFLYDEDITQIWYS